MRSPCARAQRRQHWIQGGWPFNKGLKGVVKAQCLKTRLFNDVFHEVTTIRFVGPSQPFQSTTESFMTREQLEFTACPKTSSKVSGPSVFCALNLCCAAPWNQKSVPRNREVFQQGFVKCPKDIRCDIPATRTEKPNQQRNDLHLSITEAFLQ